MLFYPRGFNVVTLPLGFHLGVERLGHAGKSAVCQLLR